jgi:hypothetical protein
MRTIIILAFACLTAFTSQAQNPLLEGFYHKYTQFDNVTDVKLQGWLLKLASNHSEDEGAEKLLEKITQLRVLVMEEGNLVTPRDYKNLLNGIRTSSFEELFKVKNTDEDVALYIREEGTNITDVLVLVNGKDNFVLLSLEGLFKFSDLNDLNIDVEGIEHLERLPEDKKSVPRA